MKRNSMMNTLNRLVDDESGVTAMEYGLIAALVAVVVISTVATLGNNLKNVFNNIANNLK